MPKAQQQTGPSYLDEHHQAISEFAEAYFDDPEERESFVDTLMERRGYKRTTGWAAPEPDPGTPDPNAGNGDGGGQGQPRKAPYFRR